MRGLGDVRPQRVADRSANGTPTTIAMVASVNACHLTTAAAWLGRRPMARSTACCRRRRTANVVRELQPSTPAGRPARLPRPALGEGLRWPARSQGRTVVGPGIEPSYRVTTGSGFWVILSSCRSMAGSASRCLSGTPRTGRRFPVAQTLFGWEPWVDPQPWAGVVHDWLYSQPGVSKSHADDVFRAVLASEGASSWKRKLMYAAVVAGGWWPTARIRREGRDLPLTVERLATRFAGSCMISPLVDGTRSLQRLRMCPPERRRTWLPNDDNGIRQTRTDLSGTSACAPWTALVDAVGA